MLASYEFRSKRITDIDFDINMVIEESMIACYQLIVIGNNFITYTSEK